MTFTDPPTAHLATLSIRRFSPTSIQLTRIDASATVCWCLLEDGGKTLPCRVISGKISWISEELKIAFCHWHFQHPCAWQYLGRQRTCETSVICIDFSITRNPGTSQQTVGSNQPWARGSILHQCRSTADRSKRTSCSQPWQSTVVVMRISWLKLGLSGYSGG
jgi:hypothetical protein